MHRSFPRKEALEPHNLGTQQGHHCAMVTKKSIRRIPERPYPYDSSIHLVIRSWMNSESVDFRTRAPASRDRSLIVQVIGLGLLA